MRTLLTIALGLGLLLPLASFARAADDKPPTEKAKIDKLLKDVQALQRQVAALQGGQDRPVNPVCPFGGPGLGRGLGRGVAAGGGVGPAYVDRDGDGVCDNLPKARAAAVKDGTSTTPPIGRAWGGPGWGRGRGWGPGPGRGPGWGRGFGPGFVDLDRDGLCDRYEERTGKH